MKIHQITILLFAIFISANAASANDSLRFTVRNLPCTDHYTYLNNDDSSSVTYDTLFSRNDYMIVFDSVGHFVDTTFYTIKDIPQAKLHIVYGKIVGLISYIHFTSGPVIGTKSVTFELRNVMTDLSLPPTHFRLHGDTIDGHNFSFAATYRFITSGGYIENAYTSNGIYHDSSLFTFSLTPEVPTAGVELPPENSDMEIYPNPALTIVHIRGADVGKDPILVYDALGKKMICAAGIEGGLDLDCTSLPNGMYLVRAGNSSKVILVRH